MVVPEIAVPAPIINRPAAHSSTQTWDTRIGP